MQTWPPQQYGSSFIFIPVGSVSQSQEGVQGGYIYPPYGPYAYLLGNTTNGTVSCSEVYIILIKIDSKCVLMAAWVRHHEHQSGQVKFDRERNLSFVPSVVELLLGSQWYRCLVFLNCKHHRWNLTQYDSANHNQWPFNDNNCEWCRYHLPEYSTCYAIDCKLGSYGSHILGQSQLCGMCVTANLSCCYGY